MRRTSVFLLIIIPLFCLILVCGTCLCLTIRKPEVPRKIAVLNYSIAANPALQGLKEGMTSLGYREGENIIYFYNGTQSERENLEKEAEALLGLGPDLFYTMSTPATLAAKAAAMPAGIPLVFGPVSSPVESGIVESLLHPGVPVTGVTFGPQEPKRLEMLREMAPEVVNVFVPFIAEDINARQGVERMIQPADYLGFRLNIREYRSQLEVLNSLKTLAPEMEAIFIPSDSMMVASTPDFVEFCLEHRIILTVPQREGVVQGALFSFGFSIRDTGFQAARLVDQILRGEKPEDLPVELSEFTLSVNLDTMEAIGRDIPAPLLNQAVLIRNP